MAEDPVSVAPLPGLRERFEFPNFDYLRLIAAGSVMFSHSFTIAQGTEANEPLVRLLGPDNIIGIYGVCVFFMISGFLITMSAANSKALYQYAAARILRIYPAFLACQLLTALILGAMFSSLGPAKYVESLHWLKYAYYYSIHIADSWDIPTVRFYIDAKDSGTGLNGSLWTITQEMFCYFIVGIMYLTRTLKWWMAALVLFLSVPFFMPYITQQLGIQGGWSRNDVEAIMWFFNWNIDEDRVYDYMWVGPSFFMGSLTYFFWSRKQALPAWPLVLSLIVLGYAVHRQHIYDLFPFFFTYPLLYIATSQRWRMPSLKKFGDISYGLYLYGWPMEQMVRGLWGEGITWWQLFGLSFLCAATAAYASWHLLEKPMLSLKRYFKPREKPMPAEALPA